MGTDPNTKKPVRPTRQDMEKADRVSDAPIVAKKITESTDMQKQEATMAIALADTATSMEQLKSVYTQYSTVKDIKVNGTTLLDVVNKKKKELE
jgi:hypothetical protein